ncbi:MAG: hypothetical protein FJY85_25630, partial [Deltaproteobacteria bacterium]|nr:hypothetical protein [Deltaproteobacteria bacterium]
SEKKTREAIEAAIETDKQIKIAFKAKEKASKSKDPADEKAAAEETDRVRLLYARSEIAYDGSLKSEDAMKEKVKIAQEAMLKAQELFEQIGSGRDDG